MFLRIINWMKDLNKNNTELNEKYWETRYSNHLTGWDLGTGSPPIQSYLDQLDSRELKILFPGAGFGHDAALAYKKGFIHSYLCDWSEMAIKQFFKTNPDFPKDQAITADFFSLKSGYDLIIEQTFFCALYPGDRDKYASKMKELLVEGGKLVGVFFDRSFESEGPPFGGSIKEYITLFSPYFKIKTIEKCYNSVLPRAGAEAFAILEK